MADAVDLKKWHHTVCQISGRMAYMWIKPEIPRSELEDWITRLDALVAEMKATRPPRFDLAKQVKKLGADSLLPPVPTATQLVKAVRAVTKKPAPKARKHK